MILSWLHSKLTWLVLTIGGIVLVFLQGVSIGKDKERVRYLTGYRKTREHMDDAETFQDEDSAAARDWLHKRVHTDDHE